MAKITKATLKSFLRKNDGKLFIRNDSNFSGMSDMVESNPDAAFRSCAKIGRFHENNLGYDGIWVCGGDWYSAYDDGKFVGISVYNCCGSFVIATKK